MTTHDEKNQVHNTGLDEVKKSRIRKFYSNPINLWGSIISFLLLVIILILLFLLCNGKGIKNELSLQNDLLKKEIAADSIYWNSMLHKMDSLIELQIVSLKKQDSINTLLVELTECCERSNRNQSQILKEIKEVRKGMDSLQNILIPQVPDTGEVITEVIPEETFERILDVQIVKTSFTKKGGSEQKILLDYSAPVSFSSLNGFAKDEFLYNYPYLNENKDSSEFAFNGFLSGNTLKVGVNHNGKSMFSEIKNFPLSQANYILMRDLNPVNIGWTSQRFYELVFDQKRFNQGTVEIIGGTAGILGGVTGLCYYATRPIVEVNVYQGDELVGTDKTYNVPMIAVSAAAIPIGTYFLIKGVNDRKFSWQLTPTEFSFKYNIDSK